ncbi:MAG: hemerythrin domain-containing protein [Desulfuromonadaceae bacterium]|nr:hemerythrin domain-containing protein [Desulfuromonadaceae bacterium]
MQFETPQTLKVEHEELHKILRKATQEAGQLGIAAKAVAELMHPHFVKEEEYALPPLGLLPELARSEVTSEMQEVLKLTDKLKADLAHMLEEHKAIVVALDELSVVAKKTGKLEYVKFAEDLKLHAQMEEEVSYPTAILIGEYVKEKLQLPKASEI